MRRSLIGLMAIGLVAAACGGDDGGGDTSASGGGGEGLSTKAQAFCDDFNRVNDELSAPDANPSFDDVLEAFRSFDPPDEIAGDITVFIDNAEVLSGVDANDPDVQSEYAEEIRAATEASANISRYVTDECGTEPEAQNGGGSGDDQSDDTADDGSSDDQSDDAGSSDDQSDDAGSSDDQSDDDRGNS